MSSVNSTVRFYLNIDIITRSLQNQKLLTSRVLTAKIANLVECTGQYSLDLEGNSKIKKVHFKIVIHSFAPKFKSLVNVTFRVDRNIGH